MIGIIAAAHHLTLMCKDCFVRVPFHLAVRCHIPVLCVFLPTMKLCNCMSVIDESAQLARIIAQHFGHGGIHIRLLCLYSKRRTGYKPSLGPRSEVTIGARVS